MGDSRLLKYCTIKASRSSNGVIWGILLAAYGMSNVGTRKYSHAVLPRLSSRRETVWLSLKVPLPNHASPSKNVSSGKWACAPSHKAIFLPYLLYLPAQNILKLVACQRIQCPFGRVPTNPNTVIFFIHPPAWVSVKRNQLQHTIQLSEDGRLAGTRGPSALQHQGCHTLYYQ